MPMDIYSTGAIRGVVRSLPVPQPYLLNLFFPNVIQSEEEEIIFDVEIKRRRVMPFCAAHVPGKAVASNGWRAERFKPPHLKDLRALDPKKPLKRLMGEQIGGSSALKPAQRAAALLNMELNDQLEMCWRRLELMAADALKDGVLTVSGEGYETPVDVDFGRPAGHTVTLTSTARWGESGVSPIDDISTWSTTMLQNSGAPVTDIVFGADAIKYLKADPKFKDSVDTTLRGSSASVETFTTPKEGGQIVGVLNNTVTLHQYANWYIDPADNTEKAVLDPLEVILGNTVPEIAQSQAFGAIIDEHLGFPAEMFAARSWLENNPSQRMLLGQSASMVVLSRPAATFRVKVR